MGIHFNLFRVVKVICIPQYRVFQLRRCCVWSSPQNPAISLFVKSLVIDQKSELFSPDDIPRFFTKSYAKLSESESEIILKTLSRFHDIKQLTETDILFYCHVLSGLQRPTARKLLTKNAEIQLQDYFICNSVRFDIRHIAVLCQLFDRLNQPFSRSQLAGVISIAVEDFVLRKLYTTLHPIFLKSVVSWLRFRSLDATLRCVEDVTRVIVSSDFMTSVSAEARRHHLLRLAKSHRQISLFMCEFSEAFIPFISSADVNDWRVKDLEHALTYVATMSQCLCTEQLDGIVKRFVEHIRVNVIAGAVMDNIPQFLQLLVSLCVLGYNDDVLSLLRLYCSTSKTFDISQNQVKSSRRMIEMIRTILIIESSNRTAMSDHLTNQLPHLPQPESDPLRDKPTRPKHYAEYIIPALNRLGFSEPDTLYFGPLLSYLLASDVLVRVVNGEVAPLYVDLPLHWHSDCTGLTAVYFPSRARRVHTVTKRTESCGTPTAYDCDADANKINSKRNEKLKRPEVILTGPIVCQLRILKRLGVKVVLVNPTGNCYAQLRSQLKLKTRAGMKKRKRKEPTAVN